MDTLEDVDEVVHEPSEEFAESTNVYQFMREHGIEDYEELVERTCRDVEGVDESGVEWFWDELVDYLGIDFYKDYDAVRGDSGARSAPENASSAELRSADSRAAKPRDDGDEPRDGAFTLAYHGRLDDATNPDDDPTEREMKAHVETVLAGEEVTAEQKPSRGCSIKWRDGNEPDYWNA